MRLVDGVLLAHPLGALGHAVLCLKAQKLFVFAAKALDDLFDDVLVAQLLEAGRGEADRTLQRLAFNEIGPGGKTEKSPPPVTEM